MVGGEAVRLVFGGAFADSDARGDMDALGGGGRGSQHGLYYRDSRHLSRWRLQVDGRTWERLDATAVEYDRALFTLGGTPAPGGAGAGIDAVLVRQRRLDAGMREHLTLTNHAPVECRLRVRLSFEVDFADLIEARDGVVIDRTIGCEVAGDRVRFDYRNAGFRRATTLRAPGAELTGDSATYRVHLPPGGRWEAEIDVEMVAETAGRCWSSPDRPSDPDDAPDWLADAPRLATNWPDLDEAYRRSLLDLAALRFHPDVESRSWMPAAGVPWYMTVFGRDSLITSYQTLPFLPGLCHTTLRALAGSQADGFDDRRDAEPGKILHELRHGESAYTGRRPQSPYYGTADATSLFLVVLDEYHRWTGDAALVRDLEPAARAALRWVEEYGDLDGSGYVKYRSRNPDQGLANQCWKDSSTSVLYPDGRLAPLPRGTCELQGNAYDARVRAARLARAVWRDVGLAERLERDAAALRHRFNEDFWLPERGYYALALDGDGHLVPTLTSNIGQLLWTGIVPQERVEPVVRHLMGPALFSGWGVRTLASGQRAYNPLAYHNGTVWPHDNSLIAAGLVRYGRHAEAHRIIRCMLEAAGHFEHTFPECLIGEERGATPRPLPFPDACSPQAWASGSVLLFLRLVADLRPGHGSHHEVDVTVDGQDRHIRVDGLPTR